MNNYPARYFKYRGINICDRPPYVLKDIVDISSGTATRQESTYYGFDGCKYINILYERRAFQVIGTIITDNYFDFVQAKRRLIAAADMKTEADAEYFNRKDSYFAKCYFLSLPSFSKRLAWTCEFTLELAIPSFYWLSLKKAVAVDDDTVINNEGDVETYPVYEIVRGTGTPPNEINISNWNESIVINYQPAAGEVITVDTFNADVYKTVGTTKTSLLSLTGLTSSFFALKKGRNRIGVNVTDGNLVTTCYYYDRFLGV